MSAENNIILITNDNEVANFLKPKLILLRDIDNITTSTYTKAIKETASKSPDAIIMYCNEEKEDAINLIKEIKTNEDLKDIPILLTIKKYDSDFVLSAFDEDIADYLVLKNDDAEILMRTIWCLKKNTLVKKVKKQQNLLEQFSVINKESGFYTNKYCSKVFETELKTLQSMEIESIMLEIAPSEESKTLINPAYLSKIIKNSTRNSDFIAHGTGNNFYILLPKTNLKGAFCVWDKIKKATETEYNLIAGLCDIEKKSFDTLKTELLNALIEAENTKKDLVVVSKVEEEEGDDWLNKMNSTQKNFKLFKQAFNKKLEKVITPIFFQMQKMYEEKLFKTKIEQYSNETISQFGLKTIDRESILKITYPGFSKINIDILNKGLDSPENKRISLDMSELDEERLTKILEEFIQEFRTTTGK